MLCSVLDYNDLLNIIVTIQGSYGRRGFDVGQRGVISLRHRLGLISYLLPSSASASCSPSTSSCGLSPAQFLSQSDQARGPIWRQTTRWSLATIELLPWEPRASVGPRITASVYLWACVSFPLLALCLVCCSDTCLEGAIHPLKTSALTPGLFQKPHLDSSGD